MPASSGWCALISCAADSLFSLADVALLSPCPAHPPCRFCPPPHVQRAAVKEKAVLFAELAKLRLSSLVATSSLFGYAFGAPVAFDLPYVATATCVTVGTLLCSASANTINQVGCKCTTSILRIAVPSPSTPPRADAQP